MTFVVAIDGPAGTGKSSVARFLARSLDFIYVDTGAIYRALAYLTEKHAIEPDDIETVLSLIPRIEIVVDPQAHNTRIEVDGLVVQNELRTENISRLSSMVSQHKKVREALLPVQRDLIKKIVKGAIFEGRDIGTVVFPKAPLKIFITANSQTRAERRYNEIKERNADASFLEVLQAIEKRDERDKNRPNAPMQKASDAQIIDTSDMTLEEVSAMALDMIKAARAKPMIGNDLW